MVAIVIYIFLLPLMNTFPTSSITNSAENNNNLMQNSTDLYETTTVLITEMKQTEVTSSSITTIPSADQIVTVPYYEYSSTTAGNPMFSSSAIVCMVFAVLVFISCVYPLKCCKNVHLEASKVWIEDYKLYI
ncbi:unnamed protein product [Adineta ricciae]|uniref:Uncharacterized protein n=1 Tax=Adineta ricciae TaxID=249248 RepID=A0A815PWK4_ADIRI|nr:unnamed protein product [Adineta ricciae]CAF1578688.1 unnamed protein product [Adineta ricciae]